MVGHTNEVEVLINAASCRGLLDSGSMVSSISESFYSALDPKPELHSLTDFSLDVSSANGSSVPYMGYVVVDIGIPTVDLDPVSVPVLIVQDTKYSSTVPVIIGTNVLNFFKTTAPSDKVPVEWSDVFSVLSSVHCLPVRCLGDMNIRIQPFETRTVMGKVRNVGEMSEAVTEGPDNSANLSVYPNLVHVKPSSSFCKVPVRMCNMSAHPVVIKPNSLLCHLQDIDVVRRIDPFEASSPKAHNSDKSLEDLGISIPTDDLTTDEYSKAEEFFSDWKHIFSSGPTDLGCTNIVEHGIEMTDSTPFKDHYRRIPPGMYEEVREHLKDMLDAGAIRESKSPFSSNVVLVRKKDGSLRFCIDYRRLNNRTIKDSYDLPRIEESIDSLAGSKFFSKLDLRSGYWQVAMKESDKYKTAFSVGPLGFYECNRMGFGLTNAPATFQRLMERAMGSLNLTECLIYLDDVIVFSKTKEEHFLRLKSVFQRLEEAGLKLKGSKCDFFRTSVKYLGHIVSANGVETDPEKIAVLRDWPQPQSLKELRSFLGFAGYYRRYIDGFSQLAKPLNDLLVGHSTNKTSKSKKSATSWCWGSEQQSAFDSLLERLSSPPILAYADFSKPFLLNTDASGVGLGAVLYQVQKERNE